MLVDEDLKYYQFDLIATFLNALIGIHTIFVKQLYSFEDSKENVYILLKALYRLKQAPLLQYNKFTKFIRKHRFDLFLSNAYVFRNATTKAIVVVYVDDILVIARLLELIFDIVKIIQATFPIRHLGKLYYYLGMRIIRDRKKRTLVLVQDGYLNKITTKFNLTRLFPSESAPLRKTLAVQLKAALEGYTYTNRLKVKYQTLVGSGVQLVYISRLDYSYKIRLLYRFLRNPTP